MLSWLSGIFTLLADLGVYVAWGAITSVNVIIAAAGAALAVLLALLPDMPGTPSLTSAPWIGWLNWLLPVAAILSALTGFVTMWGVYLLVRVPLRWLKAL